MEKFIQYTLVFHAFSGGIALISGFAAILTKKGSKNHILSGSIYLYSMLSVVITGLIVGFYRNNVFLQTVAIFSFYMVFSGKRVLSYKKEVKPHLIDWSFNLLSMAIALYMLQSAVRIFLNIGFARIAPMLMVFGFILLSMVISDFKKMWTKRFVKNNWLLDHISRMGGSFIATVTAFLLVNTNVEPAWVMWLLPTVIGTPLIIRSSNIWRKKLSPRSQA